MLYQKIINIMEELIPIGKIRRDEITTVMQPLLVKHKIVVKPQEVIDFKCVDQGASFKMRYELIDVEDNELKSILIEVAAGGFDLEGKGRATYMASTGAYRQALQQLFSIQIEDELFQQSNNDNIPTDNEQEGFGPLFDEMQQGENIITNENNVGTNQNTQTTNIQNIPNNQPANPNEITDAYIDRELADFLNAR